MIRISLDNINEKMKSEKNNFSLGARGEEIAVKYLQDNNYKILEKNFRYKKLGEIDIIAEEGHTIVFVEVKTRKSEQFGSAASAVNFYKQKKLKRLADCYLTLRKIKDKNCRFDVITIMLGEGNKIKNIDLIRNAIF